MSQETLVRWSLGLGVALAVWLGGWLAGALLLRPIARGLRRTPTELDDLLLATLRPQLPVWFGVVGAWIGAHRLGLTPSSLEVASRVAQAALILSVTFAAAGFLGDLLARRAGGWREVLPATSLTHNLVRVTVVGMGLLVVAGTLGIAITPVLTALGVGSLAVALALQPTLTNLFAGFHVTLARKIRVGDYVELENGGQGYVTDIGWRSTQIRELADNLIIVPNARLAEIVVKNYSLPQADQAVLVQVGVSYASDLAHVERVTVEVAGETLREVPGGARDFEPFIRCHTFGDSSIDFTVILRVRQFVDRYLVTHEFLKRLHARYAAEGIEIPFPQRVVHQARPPLSAVDEHRGQKIGARH